MARISRKNRDLAVCFPETSLKLGIYARLSDEDNGKKERDSIHTQVRQLEDFADTILHVQAVKVYMDNGWSGTDYERPEWECLIRDVKEGIINCIIVKDLSRFGRNYLEAGEYLETVFPYLGVRFIAVNDRYDSSGEIFKKEEMVAEFKNLANDYYSKDISKKVLSAFATKKARGEFIGSKAPYGYSLRDNAFVIDEEAAAVVRRIFSMKCEGLSFYEISRILNEEGVASPAKYAGEHGEKKYKGSVNVLWQAQAVSRIVYNRAYIGDLVQGKYDASIYSPHRGRLRDEKDWKIVENTHPAIVDRQIFEKIQKMREENRKQWRDRQGRAAYRNVLEGILVCGTCGHPMRRLKEVRKGEARYYFYCASKYNYSNMECSSSSIIDCKVFDMIKEQIRLQIDLAVETENILAGLRSSGKFSSILKEKREAKERLEGKLNRYRYLKTSIYEDMKDGILTRDEYLCAKEKYSSLISELQDGLEHAKEELEIYERNMNMDNPWMKAFLKFQGIQELTREVAVELLDKVEIYGDKRVHIRFKFRNEYEYLVSQILCGEKRGA